MVWWVGALSMLGLALLLQSGLLAYSMYALAALMLVSRSLASRKLNDIQATRFPGCWSRAIRLSCVSR